jgi:hypothetical protein
MIKKKISLKSNNKNYKKYTNCNEFISFNSPVASLRVLGPFSKINLSPLCSICLDSIHPPNLDEAS